jgi:transcriptional regulator with AAA-type ATPase domain
MTLLPPVERQFAQAVADLSYCNPFLPERIELERAALGSDFHDALSVWSRHADWQIERPNLRRLTERTETVVAECRTRFTQGAKGSQAELALYEDLVTYLLYQRFRHALDEEIAESLQLPGKPHTARCWKKFLSEYQELLAVPGRPQPEVGSAAHLLACYYQLRRAFLHIFDSIVGSSLPSARLRAAVWQTLFTCDMRYCRRRLYNRMGDFTTLVSGPSGTGKELVARAIGYSRFIPFDSEKQRFADHLAGSFQAVNLSALSATLIESELFGHVRGAFTGAVQDRIGWLEACRPLGAVFLDEIGDLETGIQVKLLRVLQTRIFQRLGDTKDRPFQGKLIAATNQDLSSRIQSGDFREDFYYRLCSDVITTPTLREQFDDCPDDLGNLVRFITERIVGDDADDLAAKIERWIRKHLGEKYAWPGNFRELEQCVRNLIVRNSYQPRSTTKPASSDARQQMSEQFLDGDLTADEMLSRYCTLVYSQTRSYEQTARRLKLDRRTVKSKINGELLARL